MHLSGRARLFKKVNNIGGANYFKLRDIAFALSKTESQFEVRFDGGRNAIALTSGQAYTPAGGEMCYAHAIGDLPRWCGSFF
jgi:hypothetical protein